MFDQCFIKYDCTVTNGVPSNLQWDEKQYVLPPFWDEFNGNIFIPNIEVINDNQICHRKVGNHHVGLIQDS